jgi:hypothetical protein
MTEAAALSGVAWAANALVFWVSARSVGVTLTVVAAVLIMAVTVLATAIPSAPGYVGTFELAVVAVAAPLGVPTETGLAFAIVAHVAGLLPTAVAGSIALARLGGDLGSVAISAVEARRRSRENSSDGTSVT